MQMIRYKSQLLTHLEHVSYNKLDYRIAVEALIFTMDGRIIHGKRGKKVTDEVGKLEGIGGSVGHHNDLHEVLQELIHNEIGPNVKVAIERLLEVRQVQFEDRDRGWLDWIVVSYLCRLREGHPEIVQLDMTESLYELTLDEFFAYPEDQLSRSSVIARQAYRAQYSNMPYYLLPESKLK
jgi:hypothetical protein